MEFDLVNIVDLFLVPLYFGILLFIILYIKKKNPQNFLIQKYLTKGFYAKMAGGLIYALLVFYYWGVGDTMSYFKDTLELRQLISDGRTNLFQVLFYDYSYFETLFDLKHGINNSGFMVIRISVLLSYFTFSRFLITTMLLGLIAYAGIFKLFQTFVSLIPNSHKMVAWFVLFFPSLNLYGAGILKDTICFSCLGWIFYCLTNFKDKHKVHYTFIPIILFCIYLIVVIKAYIIAAFILAYVLFFGLKFLKTIKSNFIKTLALPVVLLFLAGGYAVLAPSINEALGAYSVENLNENMGQIQNSYNTMTEEDGGSNFSIGTMEPTPVGILKKFPVGIVATLYRPFIWEVRKPFVFFSALESMFILFFTLFVFKKAGFLFSLKQFYSDPMVFLLIVFSLLFSGMVGLSTLNFGTLARYRIPVIPFYLMAMALVLYKKTTVKNPVVTL